MPTNARAIIEAAYGDLSVVAAEQSMDSFQGQDGLRRLNNMVSGWQTQYGTVLAVERNLFNLVANQQTYTIGLGGDFNVPRPTTIINAGLLLNGLSAAEAVTSIIRSGFTATVTQTAHPFAVGDEAYITGAVQLLYNGLQTVATVPTANTFTFTVQGTPVTPATGTLFSQAIDGTPVEIPRSILTDSAYQAIQLKNLTNSQFTNVYYNPTFPFGEIFLWPCPDTASNQLVLYLQNVFEGFADLTTEYAWPSNPGYAEALQYQLALRLAIPNGRQVSDELRRLAAETLGLIKRANNTIFDLPSDAALLTGDRRGGYNVNTGTGG